MLLALLDIFVLAVYAPHGMGTAWAPHVHRMCTACALHVHHHIHQALIDLFVLNINNCCGCQLDEATPTLAHPWPWLWLALSLSLSLTLITSSLTLSPSP